MDLEMVFVDDCSKDSSREILKRLATGDSRIKAIFKEKNEGKGSALQRGFEEATGDIIIVQDADLEYNPREIPSLLQPIVEDKADVVYGSRFSHMSSQVVRFYHYLGNKCLTLCSNFFSDIRLSDMETCYKCFKAEIIKNTIITSLRFGFEPEITAKIAKLNLRIHELPISYNQRSYAEGKKIGIKDGFEALWYILKFNLFTTSSESFKPGMPAKYLKTSGLYK
jgi:glycosyltransferase involved in cell wall biosynthesis